jgi:hypothetical protein
MKQKQENNESNNKDKETKKLSAEELEARVAMSVPGQKKSLSPAPYAPGTRYGLIKRSHLKDK